MTPVVLDQDQVRLLSTLAAERQTSVDALLSLAVKYFLARQQAHRLQERTNAAYTDPEEDAEAAREEAALAASRRSTIRRINRVNREEGDTGW